MATIPQPYYVYVLARPNGAPFYVGKGKGKRVYDHEKEARSGHQCHKCHVIRKIWQQSDQVQRYIVFTTTNEQEALDYECDMITLFGRANLTNKTNGGGRPGVVNDATKQKLSAKNKGYVHTEEARQKIIQAGTGREVSEETRQKISAAHTGMRRSDETRRRLSESHKGKPQKPDAVRRGAETRRGVRLRPQTEEERDQNALRVSGGKTYTIIAPDGVRYEHIVNASSFARTHGLRPNLLRMVLRDERPHHQGWTGFVE